MMNLIKIGHRIWSLNSGNNFSKVLLSSMSSSNDSKKPKINDWKDKDNLQMYKLTSKDGVFIDQQRIKAKMKEIKERRQKEIGEKKKNNSKQFMQNYQINKEPSKILKFRKDTDTQNLMNIEDVSLDEKPTVLQITSFSNQYIEVDNFFYPPSIIVTPNQLFLWQIKNINQIKVEHLKMIEMVTPTPEYIIIGCDKPLQIPHEIRDYLQKLGINYDIIEMFEAISNFNNFAGDDVKILAFFWCGD